MADVTDIREAARQRYARAATGGARAGSHACCEPATLATCCEPAANEDCCGVPSTEGPPARCGCQS